MKDFIAELEWRGMLAEAMPGTREKLNEGMATAYVGFDPTASSIHIGNLATLMLLVHYQRCGHKPMVLVGGATGMVGDPSGKSAERNLLDEATIRANVDGVTAQLKQYLSFEGDNAAVVVNNLDWFGSMGFLTFLREVGKHLTVNYMMAKESVKNRLETGLSFTEFSYQLLQAYDFYYLNKNQGVLLQMGGADQWGNITSGTELIRRMGGGEAFAITTPLITKQDGSKFGKSEAGNVWLDAERTSPYKFYQFWLNVSDEEVPRLIRVYTVLDRETIEALEAEHNAAPHLRILQKRLAEEVTRMVHGQEELDRALAATDILFGKGGADAWASLDERTVLDAMAGVPQRSIASASYSGTWTEFLAGLGEDFVAKGKGAARKDIEAGAISVNGHKLTDANAVADLAPLQQRYLIIRKGKKQYFLVTLT